MDRCKANSRPVAGYRVALAAAALACGAARADFTAQVSAQDDAGGHQVLLTLESHRAATGRMSRLDIPDGGYMLFRDGKVYMGMGGIAVVMDLSQLGTDEGGSAAASLGANEIVDIIGLEGPHGKETVAGIPGQVYQLTWRDTRTDEIVLSTDFRARALLQAWAHMNDVMKDASLHDAGQAQLVGLLAARHMGWLRIGNRTRLTSFEHRRLSPERFALPGPVLELPPSSQPSPEAGASSASMPAAKKDSGDLLNGLLGEEAAHHAERQQSRANSATDQGTENAVDRAVDRALERLFAN